MQDIPDLTFQASETAADVFSRKLPDNKLVNILLTGLILFVGISITVLQNKRITDRHLGLFAFILIVLVAGFGSITYLLLDGDSDDKGESDDKEKSEEKEDDAVD